MRRCVLISCLVFLVVWCPALAVAQHPDGVSETDLPVRPSTVTPVGRTGLLLGFDLFAGNGLESNAAVASGLGMQVGWMLRPRLAVMLDTHGTAVGSSQIDATEVSSSVRVRALIAAAMQWWPTERLWLRGGLGPARVEGVTASVGIVPSAGIEETKSGFGMTMVSGFELYQGSLFALDLHARYTGIQAAGKGYNDLVAGLGFAWYPQTVTLHAAQDGTERAEGSSAEGSEKTRAKKKDDWNRWVLGLTALGGRPFNNDCEDCYWDLAAGMAFEIGYMLTPRLRLSFDTHAAAVGKSQIEGYGADAAANAHVQGIVGITAQVWTGRRTWIKAGIGRGEARQSVTITPPEGGSFDIIETEHGFGTQLAVGYEIHRSRALGVNVNARYAGIYGDHLNRASLFLGVGMGWYVF